MIDDDQGCFRVRKGYVDETSTQNKIGEKAREKKRRVYVNFIDLEKAYGKVSRETAASVENV